jgi:hypothetical protein
MFSGEIRTDLGDINIEFFFEHASVKTVADADPQKVGTKLDTTFCTFVVDGDIYDECFRHINQFSKAVGRRATLAAAMKAAGLCKTIRKMIWLVYFQKCSQRERKGIRWQW